MEAKGGVQMSVGDQPLPSPCTLVLPSLQLPVSSHQALMREAWLRRLSRTVDSRWGQVKVAGTQCDRRDAPVL